MRKLLCITLTFMLLGLSPNLWAQASEITVLYTTSVKGITYSQEGGNEQRVFAGLQLPTEGQLRLTAGTEARLLYQNKKIVLEGPGLYTMSELRAKAQSTASEGFLSRFWSFVSNSIKETDTAEQVENYHRQYLTNARAGISGFADRKFDISAPLYLTQAIDYPQLTFRWDSTAHPQGYYFTITKETAEEPVFSAVTSEAQISVHLEELLLQPSAIYVWQVSALQADSTKLESQPFYFSYEQDASEYIEEMKEDDDYLRFTPQERELYLLYRLEEDGLLHHTYRRYQKLTEPGSPDSALYEKLFISFLVRMDALEEAKSLVK